MSAVAAAGITLAPLNTFLEIWQLHVCALYIYIYIYIFIIVQMRMYVCMYVCRGGGGTYNTSEALVRSPRTRAALGAGADGAARGHVVVGHAPITTRLKARARRRRPDVGTEGRRLRAGQRDGDAALAAPIATVVEAAFSIGGPRERACISVGPGHARAPNLREDASKCFRVAERRARRQCCIIIIPYVNQLGRLGTSPNLEHVSSMLL